MKIGGEEGGEKPVKAEEDEEKHREGYSQS